MKSQAYVAAAAVVGLVATLTACTGDPPASKASGPSYESLPCPGDVEVLIVPVHECGFVRPESDGAMKIFVVSVEPPTPSDLSPILETGVDLGMTPTYGGLAPIAQRTGRRLIILDMPGTGHSEPSMDCPEVESLGDPAASDNTGGLADAVAACRDEVAAAGVDPADLTPDRLGEVLHAVMTALGAPRWVVMGHGTTAEAGRQVAIAHPELVEALVLDSVIVDPQVDIDAVVTAVASACLSDRYCNRTYGDPAHLWDSREEWRRGAADRGRRPGRHRDHRRRCPGTCGSLGVGAGRPRSRPSSRAARRGSRRHGRTPAHVLRADPLGGTAALCRVRAQVRHRATGRPRCDVVGDVPDRRRHRRLARRLPSLGVGLDTESPRELVGVPTLALYGAHDPFATPDHIREQLGRLVPDAFLAEQASGGHNVLGTECPRDVRNAWLAGAVETPPAPLPCMSDAIDFHP